MNNVPIFGQYYRQIRQTQLMKWLYEVNHLELRQNQVKIDKNNELEKLLYYFLTSQDEEYSSLCLKNGYEELSYAINSDSNDFRMREFFEKTISVNLADDNTYPLEVRMIYSIAYLGDFKLLVDFFENNKTENDFMITWKQILLLVLRYKNNFYNTEEGQNNTEILHNPYKDISLLFENSSILIGDLNNRLSKNQMELNLEFYIINYFCKPSSFALKKIESAKLRNKYPTCATLPFIFYTILNKVANEYGLLNIEESLLENEMRNMNNEEMDINMNNENNESKVNNFNLKPQINNEEILE